MPIHDWTRVDAGIFHAFHHDWITDISRALNRGLLPAGYYALPEQLAGGLGPDILTLRAPGSDGPAGGATPPAGGVALALVPKAVTIRHVSRHQVVAMVEVVSPGNKNNQNGFNAFVRKARETLAAGMHLLLIDLFPPGARDPQGIHQAIWGDDCGPDFALPPEKPLTCVSYIGGACAEVFGDFIAVGDELPEMPLFLTADEYVDVPLEPTYKSAWDGMPSFWRDVLAST
jgi:hypothetical protein